MADSKLIWASTRPGDGGVFFRGPLGTPLPTMADAPWALEDLDPAFVDHGWMGDDGITNSPKRDTVDHQAFGGDVVKTTQDKYTETLKVTCFESNEAVLKTMFGNNSVTFDGTSGHRQLTVTHSSAPLERSVFVVRVIEGEKTRLIMVEEGCVITVDDIVHVNKDLVKYTATVMCYKPDADTDAVTELIDEPDEIGPFVSATPPVATPGATSKATVALADPTGSSTPFTYSVEKSVSPFSVWSAAAPDGATYATAGVVVSAAGTTTIKVTSVTAGSTKFRVIVTGANGVSTTSVPSNAATII